MHQIKLFYSETEIYDSEIAMIIKVLSSAILFKNSLKHILKMKNLIPTLFTAVLLITTACEDDAPTATIDEISTIITANDLNTSIDENPSNGAVITNFEATVNQSNITYAITSQSVSGAISIDANSGAISVADASAFDYETNTSITGTIKITAADATEKDVNFTITINDVDFIRENLSTSQSAYDAASDGDWITVTEAEYNALATEISSVTRSGMPEDNFLISNTTLGWSNYGHVTSLAGTSVDNVPTGSYLFAFKFIRHESNTSIESRVKLSETNETDGFVNVGTALPDASGNSSSIHYYVLKGNNTATTATNSYVGFYCNANVIASSRALFPNVYTNTKIGETSTGDGLVFNEHEVFFQSLSSTANDIGW